MLEKIEFSHGTDLIRSQGIRISFIKHYEGYSNKKIEQMKVGKGEVTMGGGIGYREFALKLSKVMGELEKIY